MSYIIRFRDAGHDDPDRQIALRICRIIEDKAKEPERENG